MCGIFGVASQHPLPEPRPLLEALTDRLRHRGPDERGSHVGEGIFLGHRRLAIIDLKGGRQPMSAGAGRFTIVYNGELYNAGDLRAALQARGHRFSGQSDTEVVLNAYVEWGPACLAKLEGMFAIAVWDSQRRELFLARDRLGIKPLYYGMIGQRLVFASEMKAITAHPDFDRCANLAALSSYLTFRSVLGEETVFKGLKSLQPGHFLRFHAGRSKLERYWDIPDVAARPDHGEAYYLDRLNEMLPAIIKRHLVSDVPVGAYLSGGLDSSLMVALMAQFHAGPIKTYSVGFDVDGYDEGAYAAMASAHLGTEHHHLTLSAETFIDSTSQLIEHRDQPLSIPHEAALFALSKRLKQDVTVCLSGEGADELFGGYGRVQRSAMDYNKLALFQRLPAAARRVVAAAIHDPDLKKRLALADEVEHFFHVYHWWPFEEKWQVLADRVNQAHQFDGPLKAYCRSHFDSRSSRDPYDRLFYFFERFHLVNLLERLDVQSMAASVEARVPFADHTLVEFVTSMPLKYKMRWKSPLHGLRACFSTSDKFSEKLDISKYLLRRVADAKLPSEISRRKKLGFPVPLDAWFGGARRGPALDILLDDRTRQRGVFNMQKLEQFLINPQRQAYDAYGKRVWMLMNVELWFRAHIDQNPKASL